MSVRAVTSVWVRILVLALLIGLVPVAADAVCTNTTETDEQALWNRHNCWNAFRDWYRPYFKMKEKHWDDGWGWGACDPTQAEGKFWNSAYLLTYGLDDDTLGPWHSNADYYRWASGAVHGFQYRPDDDNGAFASAHWGFFVTDRVEMKCPSFNNRTAGVRAGTILHESTHIMFKSSHQANNPGSNCPSPCSDDWFFHNLNSYPYGSMASDRHSMVQVQIEFICDLSEFGEWWVPVATANAAGAEANNRMNNRILNPPGWTCGTPRPLFVPPDPPQPGPCPSNTVCCGEEFGGVCLGWCEDCSDPDCNPNFICQEF